MLRPRRPPRVVQLETLVAEIGPAVGATLCGLQRLGRLAELAHHSHTAQADGVSIPCGDIGSKSRVSIIICFRGRFK